MFRTPFPLPTAFYLLIFVHVPTIAVLCTEYYVPTHSHRLIINVMSSSRKLNGECENNKYRYCLILCTLLSTVKLI